MTFQSVLSEDYEVSHSTKHAFFLAATLSFAVVGAAFAQDAAPAAPRTPPPPPARGPALDLSIEAAQVAIKTCNRQRL